MLIAEMEPRLALHTEVLEICQTIEQEDIKVMEAEANRVVELIKHEPAVTYCATLSFALPDNRNC